MARQGSRSSPAFLILCWIASPGLGASLPTLRNQDAQLSTGSVVPWLGFSQTEKTPKELFARMNRALHASASETVKFELYTRKGPNEPVRIFAREKDSIRKSSFDPRKPTKFAIHGYLSHQGPGSGGESVKNALLSALDCNVITVDWHDADVLVYPTTVSVSLPKVGSEVADLIDTLHSLGADLDDMHILGHSLGAQIAGIAGSKVLGPVGKGRITGLDPAGPLFEGMPSSARLDPSDAGFVDAIHTDGGRLGMVAPCAHVDFYPEGGMHPYPGCGNDVFGMCSHCLIFDIVGKALEKPEAMVFRKCASWEDYKQGKCENSTTNVMGIKTNPRDPGLFFLASLGPIPEEFRNLGEKEAVEYFPTLAPLGGDFRC